jgi:hypothetical protein
LLVRLEKLKQEEVNNGTLLVWLEKLSQEEATMGYC